MSHTFFGYFNLRDFWLGGIFLHFLLCMNAGWAAGGVWVEKKGLVFG